MLSEQNLKMLKECAGQYEIDLNPIHLERFSKYADILIDWNKRINLTAITDPEDIVIKHFVDSLSILPLLPKDTHNLIDVGTGAGFPGIPLKIVNEELKVTLLDSLDKRIKFLNEVCEKLQLKQITAFHGRAEDYGIMENFRESFDVVVARAVAALPVLLEYCLPFVKVGGVFIAMKGQDINEELIKSKKAAEILGGELVEVKKFHLPYSDYERSIVKIRKCRHTQSGYPRKSGKPTRMPIE